MRNYSQLGLTLIALSLALGMSAPAWAADPAPPPQGMEAQSVELVDAASHQVLFEKDANKKLPMASVTKLMTLYLAIKAIEQHKIRLTDLVPVSDEAYRIKGSQIWLEPGERLTVGQMITAISVGSANDAAYALGEYIGGSEAGFVGMMNHTAKKLGMTHTHFANPHGLHMPDHFTTAHDLAILAEHAVKHPLLLKYTSMWQDRSLRNGKGGKLWLINNNRLLRQYAGCDGLKTGYTNEAGFCIAATAQRANTRMIAIVLGAPSAKARNADAASLMNWGFQNFRTIPVVKQGQVMGAIRVIRGKNNHAVAIAPHAYAVTVPMNDSISQRISLPKELKAPIVRDQKIGQLTVKSGRKTLKQIALVPQHGVPAVTFPGLVWGYIWRILG